VDLFVIIVNYYGSRLNSATKKPVGLTSFLLGADLDLCRLGLLKDLDLQIQKTRRFPTGGLAGTCRSGWTRGMPWTMVYNGGLFLAVQLQLAAGIFGGKG